MKTAGHENGGLAARSITYCGGGATIPIRCAAVGFPLPPLLEIPGHCFSLACSSSFRRAASSYMTMHTRRESSKAATDAPPTRQPGFHHAPLPYRVVSVRSWTACAGSLMREIVRARPCRTRSSYGCREKATFLKFLWSPLHALPGVRHTRAASKTSSLPPERNPWHMINR